MITATDLEVRAGARTLLSTLARECDVHLDVRVEKEACPLNLAPTASTTATLAMGDALAVALLMARVGRSGTVYRFLIYFPALVPGVVAGLIWIFLTNVDFGLFNTLLRTAGLTTVTWLGPKSALQVIAALDVWRTAAGSRSPAGPAMSSPG